MDATDRPGSVAEAARLLATGATNSVTLTQAALDRIAATDERLHAFVTVAADRALAEAAAADAERATGRVRGPLHGVPYAAKDLYATAGLRTTAHSAHLLDHVPDRDATAVRLMRDAGAVLLGKLAMHEFAFGGPADDLPFPPARNPNDPDRVPGGSSSGSGVSVAAGQCLVALGSDTGGSIRDPAARCGVVGLKPTFGRVGRTGVVRLSDTLDHCGPLTATVDDAAIVLDALCRFDPTDPDSVEAPPPPLPSGPPGRLDGMRVGVLTNLDAAMPGIEPSQVRAQADAESRLVALGARLVPVTFPLVDLAAATSRAILFAEAHALHADRLRTAPDRYCRITRERLTLGAFVGIEAYRAALAARPVIRRAVEALFADVDVLALPAATGPAPRFGSTDELPFSGTVAVGNAFNVTGHPVLTVPIGRAEGLPLGMQLVAGLFREDRLYAVGRALEVASRADTIRALP